MIKMSFKRRCWILNELDMEYTDNLLKKKNQDNQSNNRNYLKKDNQRGLQIRKGLKLKKGSVLHCFSLLLKIKEAKQVCFTKLLSKNTYSVGKLYKPITIDGTLNMFEMSYSENFFSVPHLISWNIYIKMQHSTTLLWKNVIQIWSSISVNDINT